MSDKAKHEDEVLRQVRVIKAQLAARVDYDIDRMCEEARQHQAENALQNSPFAVGAHQRRA